MLPKSHSSCLLSYNAWGCLQLTRVNNGGTLVLDSTAAGASSLTSLDDVEGLLVSDLAEDDVSAVEPRGDDGGDEELRAVAAILLVDCIVDGKTMCLRVRAGVGHGQQTRLVVLQLEVLIGELLAVDGLATGTLYNVSLCYVIFNIENVRYHG